MITKLIARVSRAVTSTIKPGNEASCTICDDWLKFAARRKHRQIICNVYIAGKWDRVEHFHPDCYRQAGQPHGSPGSEVKR